MTIDHDPYFDVDRRIFHPSHKVPMLTWWAGIYDHVFVAPHPFYQIAGYAGVGSAAFPDGDQIKREGEAFPWAEVHQAVAPEVPRDDFYRATWLLGCVGYQERADIALQQRIEAYCVQEKLYLPDDGGLPPILEVNVGAFLCRLGVDRVTAYDEFRHNSLDADISAFNRDLPHFTLSASTTSSRAWGLHLPDLGALMTWDFDGTEAIIAMTSEALQRAQPEHFFEGWYADGQTYSDVFNPRDFFPRQL